MGVTHSRVVIQYGVASRNGVYYPVVFRGGRSCVPYKAYKRPTFALRRAEQEAFAAASFERRVGGEVKVEKWEHSVV